MFRHHFEKRRRAADEFQPTRSAAAKTAAGGLGVSPNTLSPPKTLLQSTRSGHCRDKTDATSVHNAARNVETRRRSTNR